ncbi:putative Methionine synthase, vitamin-B12 independent [Mycolicibacterium hippocampi]|uniref:Putative Methionine synthase, vitamin-B12 independent n=1 Tax=Mycolicibacterium hippocampi TaxID=659824 RepID=A0A850PTI3_9MYCO|nr:putative Methionine synthase, vitamin-B12 independent [Mycolicibacterium hippocampi]
MIVGELHRLPHLVELPVRGVGADLIGRAGAILVDISIDTVPRGYRIAPGRRSVTRRAMSFLDEDIDALEEAWEKAGLRGSGRTVKVQASGPVTLAAHLELPGGHRAITDTGAVRDLTRSLAEGMAALRAQIARRLESDVVVQFDEPSLPAALLGRLTGVSTLSPVHPVDEAVVTELLDECVAVVGGDVAVHSCAAGLPWKLLQHSAIAAVSVDVNTLTAADLDGVGEFVESGRTVLLGAVPTTVTGAPPSAAQIAATVAGVTDRLGFPRGVLRDRIGVTPSCGLAAATPEWARTAIELAQRAADAFAEDPEAV